MPQKAPVSIMPSRPMLMTPLRSDTMPPSAANSSGVAKRSIEPISADQVNTSRRLLWPDFVAATAPTAASTPPTTAPHPSRRSSDVAYRPSATAATASTMDGTGLRTSAGGTAMNAAITAQATPAQPARLRGVMSRIRLLHRLRPSSQQQQRAAPAQDPQRDHVGRHDQDDEALDHQRQVRRQRRVEDRRVEVALRRAALQGAEQ